MTSRYLAVALLAGGCGEVASTHPAVDAGGQPDSNRPPDAAMGIPFKGTMAQTPVVPFGGTPYCNYTITLKQIEIDLDILTSGQVTTGGVQALNVEGTDANCPYPPAPAAIANYTLQSSVPNGTATRLTFQGATGNAPAASLVANLSSVGTGYSAMLTFHRTDQGPPLDWIVNTTLTLVQ